MKTLFYVFLKENDDFEEKNNNNFFSSPKYFINQKYNKDIKRIEKLEVNSEILLLNENMDKNLITYSEKDLCQELRNIKFIDKNKFIYFKKEFNETINDSIGFFRSCYLNEEFLKDKRISKDLKLKTLYFEFEALFKSYRFYKLFINQFDDYFNDSMNIIQIAYFVLNFMKKYNDNYVRYFIILDSVPYDLLKELNEYEREARKDKNCYIIELFQNKNMEDILYRNVIDSNIEDDELSLYQNNYSDLKLVQDLDKKDLDFLLNNFGESLFYYQKFKKWKKNNNNNNYNEFLLITMNEIENDLLEEFTNKNEAKSFYRYILLTHH